LPLSPGHFLPFVTYRFFPKPPRRLLEVENPPFPAHGEGLKNIREINRDRNILSTFFMSSPLFFAAGFGIHSLRNNPPF
jgi:hypothetical protein